MKKILWFLVLGIVTAHAQGAGDKFDLSLVSAALRGSTIEFTLKIVNQSAGPVKVDLASDVAIVKADRKSGALQTPGASTRAGMYKARFIILVPGDKMVFMPSNSARVFAPKTLAPGESCTLTKSLTVDPVFLMKDLAAAPYEVLAGLSYQSDADHSAQSTAPSPTYKITRTPDDQLALTPE